MGIFDAIPGLLTPDQVGMAKSQAMESAAAALLKASGPSPYKNNWGPAIGAGIEGLMGGWNQGLNTALQRNQMQMGTVETLYKISAATGVPVEQLIKSGIPGIPNAGGAPPSATPGPITTPQPGPTPPQPPALSPPPGAGPTPSPAPGAPQGSIVGRPGETLMPSAPPSSPAPQPGASGPLAGLTPQERIAMIFGSPQMADMIAKNHELTTSQKDAAASGYPSPAAYEAGKAGDTAAATRSAQTFDSIYRGWTGGATIAAQQKQNIALLREVAASPNFVPGAGSSAALGFQRLAAQFGINPAGAAPREVFNQVAARVLADQFSGMKSMSSETGEQGGRLFKPMLDLEEKANITPDDSLAGINSKLDILDRAGDAMMHYGDMADDYAAAHGGRLDAGFNKSIRAEVSKTRIGPVLPADTTAPPVKTLPIFKSPADVHAAVAAKKLKSGDAFLDETGTRRTVP